MTLRNTLAALAVVAAAAALSGCPAETKTVRTDPNYVKVRPDKDKAKLRAEVDRVLAGGAGGQKTPDEDVALESELLSKLEKRLDEKLGAKVDAAYDTEAEFDVAFETAIAQELDAPLQTGEVPIVEKDTGQMVGVYSEQTGEVTPLLAGTEDELVASIFQDSGAEMGATDEFGAAAAPEPKYVAVRGALRDVHYAFDRYTLSDEARQVLQENAELIRGIDGRVVIEGHCDTRGSVEYNLALGEKRARSAYDYLVTLGVDPDRIDVISYGEERPLDGGDNEIAWAKNRRAHFRAGGQG